MACSASRPDDLDTARRLAAGQSRTVAVWALVSRITGFARVAVIAAVLGPTWSGNLFQLVLVLTTTLYSLLAGSQFANLLVPLLVPAIDRGDAARARQIANGALGMILVPLASITLGAAALGSGLLFLLTLGLSDEAARAQAMHSGAPLLWVMLPQAVLYGVVGTGIAVQQAHRRFGLATAGSALENLAVIAVFLAAGSFFGELEDPVSSGLHLVVLGAGSTAAVGVHAAAQWWGARRAGMALLPRAGWRDPELRDTAWRGLATVGYTGLYWSAFFLVMAAAAGVPGGAVAFQIAHSCGQLPIALAATPVAVAHMPLLARIAARPSEFETVYREGTRLVFFAAIPVGSLLLAIPATLASAVAFGKMGTQEGIGLIAAFLLTLGPGVPAEAIAVLATMAAYARREVGLPLRAMFARLLVVAAGVAGSVLLLHGVALLAALGAAMTAGNFVAAAWLHFQQTSPRRSDWWRLGSSRAAWIAIQLAALVPALAIAGWLGARGHGPLRIAVAAAAVSASLGCYTLLHWLRGSHELRTLLPAVALPRLRKRAS
jgi:putative peptidoglycan lipid II flippase